MATSHAFPVPLDLDALCAAEAKRIRTLRTQLVVFHPFWSTLQMPMQVESTSGFPPSQPRRCPAHLDQPALDPPPATAQAAGLHPPPRGGPRGAPSRPPPGPPRSPPLERRGRLRRQRPPRRRQRLRGKAALRVPGRSRSPISARSPSSTTEVFKGLSAEAIYARLESHAPETCPLCGSRHTLLQPPISGAPNSRPQRPMPPRPRTGAAPTPPRAPRRPASHPHESPQTGASSGTTTPGIPPCTSGHRSTRPVERHPSR